MKTNSSKSAKHSEKKRLRLNKKSSIVILAVVSVLLILAAVFGFVSLNQGELGITDYNAYVSNIKLGLDLKGGVYAVYEAQYPDDYDANNEEDRAAFLASLNGTAVSLQDLLFSKGFPEAQVSVTESDRQIRVEVPNVEDPEKIFQLIGRPATLEFFEVTQSGNSFVKVDNAKAYVTGKDIISASVSMDENSQYVIALKFNSAGAKKFAAATEALNGKYLGIYLNKELLMAPQVNAVISNGEAIITGNYTYDQAYEYAVSIQSGALPVELNLLEQDTISPTLGTNAVRDGLIAGGVGLLLIILFMIWRYRMLGVAASISLIYFSITYLFFLSIFPWVQLTLPGIAGILLSIGMAVDANVIIFERIKEERQSGKNLRDSFDEGFSRSYSAILDGNVTTIIGAVVLIILAAATIKGFAITLLIGIIISLFSSLFFTRLILKTFTALTAGKREEVLDKLYGTNVGVIDYSIVDNSSEKASRKPEKDGKKTPSEVVKDTEEGIA